MASEPNEGFIAEERAAIQERVRELRAERQAKKGKADGERDVLTRIVEMPEPDRTIAGRIHAIIKTVAPELTPKTWYGMPAYARDGIVICFFQSANKFKTRYATLGFTDTAHLDEDDMWPVAFALKELTPAVEAQISALLKKAVR
ncbi:MAG: iron chaperone [Chloroflexus sp.]|uniref:iron chaperone n=1 Tax=Chloroflexus sp. TaxID=1904827 RepID=UPI00404B2787